MDIIKILSIMERAANKMCFLDFLLAAELSEAARTLRAQYYEESRNREALAAHWR